MGVSLCMLMCMWAYISKVSSVSLITFILSSFFYYLELDAYSAIVTAFRAQGDINK